MTFLGISAMFAAVGIMNYCADRKDRVVMLSIGYAVVLVVYLYRYV